VSFDHYIVAWVVSRWPATPAVGHQRRVVQFRSDGITTEGIRHGLGTDNWEYSEVISWDDRIFFSCTVVVHAR
jgi:hypothetical protein